MQKAAAKFQNIKNEDFEKKYLNAMDDIEDLQKSIQKLQRSKETLEQKCSELRGAYEVADMKYNEGLKEVVRCQDNLKDAEKELLYKKDQIRF